MSSLLGPDGLPVDQMREPDPASVAKPAWLERIQPGTVYPIAGEWFKLEQAVTNGAGQWALILVPVGPTRKEKTRGKRKRA